MRFGVDRVEFDGLRCPAWCGLVLVAAAYPGEGEPGEVTGVVSDGSGDESGGVLHDVAALPGDWSLVPEVLSSVVGDVGGVDVGARWEVVQWSVDAVGEEWSVDAALFFDEPVDVLVATRQDMHKLDGSEHGWLRRS